MGKISQKTTEIWKDIKGYEGYYQISNYGRVRSLDHYVKERWGMVFIKGKILKTSKNSFGYQVFRLAKDGVKKMANVHRIVAETFIPNPNNYPCVLHKVPVCNGGTNCVENLYWGTQKDNINDCIKDGHWKNPNIKNMKNIDNTNESKEDKKSR